MLLFFFLQLQLHSGARTQVFKGYSAVSVCVSV